jgi:hypothetical protein
MQNNTQMQIQRAIMQQAINQNSGSKSGSNSKNARTGSSNVSGKSLAVFTPTAKSDNL